VDQRLTKIRLVTERFSELKGLHVAYAGALWASFGGVLRAQADVTPMHLVVAFAVVVAAYLPGKWWLDRYYASRFGRIVVGPLRRSKLWLLPAFAALALVNTFYGVGALAGAFLIVAGESLWIAIRDWPARSHYLMACVAAASATALQFGSESRFFGPAQALGLAIIGIGFIPVGLLDHRLLTSVMRHTDAQYAAASRE
jgi:hypothetical protein